MPSAHASHRCTKPWGHYHCQLAAASLVLFVERLLRQGQVGGFLFALIKPGYITGATCKNRDRALPYAHQNAITCTSGLVAMTSASHAEGRQFDPGLVYFSGAV